MLLLFLLIHCLVQSAQNDPVGLLQHWLKQPVVQRTKLDDQPFASIRLSRNQAEQARKLLIEDDVAQVRSQREQEWKNRAITLGKLTMKFDVRVFGEKPVGGRSLFISMHGGGNTAARVNDQQWENQKGLYRPKEGVYIAPRAPNDAWDMWFQPHMDAFFTQLIADAVSFGEVNVNRVYLMGYSAGGDGVYRLAPRLADRWAAAAMMAGHPGDVKADNLRNLPFTLHMGENDQAYNRSKTASEWKTKLADLRREDPEGYIHEVVIQPGMGHWMKQKDAVAVPWMAQYTRNTIPNKVVWQQPTQPAFYWLAQPVSESELSKAEKANIRIVASVNQQTITIESRRITALTVRLRDDLINLDQPIVVLHNGKEVYRGTVARAIKTIHRTLAERHDAGLCFDAELLVK